MPSFPNSITHAIKRFGDAMDMEREIEAASDGTYTFVFETTGILTFMPSRDEDFVIISLGRKPATGGGLFLETFLKSAAANADQDTHLQHAGLGKDGLAYLSLRFSVTEFDYPTLEHAVDQLSAAFDEI